MKTGDSHMNEVNRNKPAIISGVLTDIRSVPTQTGTPFAVCKVGGKKCKLFGEVAKLILANQDQYEGQQTEAQGYWDVRRGNEFVIDGFVKQPLLSTSKPVSDNRPDQPAMEVIQNYIVITIPVGSTHEQIRRITSIANEALRGVGPGVFDSPVAQVETIHPKDQYRGMDIEF
jgi:hypothetical protein